MNPSRESIYSALFALVNIPSMLVENGGLFRTITRAPKLWGDYEAESKPLLGMLETEENYVYQHGTATPPHITLGAEFFIYTYQGNLDIPPSIVVNNCIDAVEACLQPSKAPGAVQDLGGLVHSAWIETSPKKAPGYLDGNGLAIIPIKILVPF